MTEFENKIKESLENYSVPDATPDWSTFEQKLDATNKRKNGTGLIAAAVIGILAGLAFVYNTDTQPTASLIADNQSTEKTTTQINVAQSSTVNNQLTEVTNKSTEENTIEKATSQENVIDNESSIVGDALTLNIRPSRLMMNESDDNFISKTQKDEKSTPPNKIAPHTTRTTTEVIVSKKVSCIDERVQFSTSDRCNCSYKWNFGDGTQSFDKMPSHNYESEGTYKVAVTITSKETRKSTYAYRADVKVSPNPIADFEYTKPNWNECETEHQFMSTNTGTANNHWYVGGKKVANGSSIKYPLHNKGIHTIELVTENSNGCKSSYSHKIEIYEDYSLGARKWFRPSVGDLWLPRNILCLENEFNLVITSYEGVIVFKTNSPELKWDGTKMGSTDRVKSGETYAWSATYIDNNEITRQVKGAITIR